MPAAPPWPLQWGFGCGQKLLQITVNDKPEQVDTVDTVATLLDRLALTGKRIAVERNGQIVPKSEHQNTTFSEGDIVEIVVAVGGG